MKTSLLRSALALLALCSAATVFADSTDQIPGGSLQVARVTAPNPVNGDSVVIGDSRVMASLRLGSPHRVLPDGSWLYRGYTATDAQEREYSCNLIVRFSQSKVSALVLADQPTVTALLQKPKSPANPGTQLAATGR